MASDAGQAVQAPGPLGLRLTDPEREYIMRTRKSTGHAPAKTAAFYAERRVALTAANLAFKTMSERRTDFRQMRPGAERRAALIAWLSEGRSAGERRVVYVNRKYCPQVGRDRDLRYLLKRGVLVQRRANEGYSPSLGGRAGSFRSYLELAE